MNTTPTTTPNASPSLTTKTEQAFIGACLLYQQDVVAYALTANLVPDWFSDQHAAGMWKWIMARFRQGKGYNFAEALDCTTSEVGKAWIHAAVDLCVTAESACRQLADIRDGWLKRQGTVELRKAQVNLEASTEPGTALCTSAKNLLELAHTQEADLPIGEVAVKQYELWKNRSPTEHLYWPISKMQRAYGFIEHDLICLLAPPSVGKTAFSLQASVEWARKQHRVAYKSLESRKPQLAARLVSYIGQVNVSRIRKGVAPVEDHATYLAACETLKKLPIDVDDTPADIPGVFAWAVTAKQRGAKVLILDNLKHIRTNNSKKDTVEQFRELFLGCKWIRDDVDLPFIILHHTNQDGEAAWSRDIERDADIMLHMTKTVEENKGDPINEHIEVEFEFRKYRDDASGLVIPTTFNRRTQSFEETL